MRIPVVRPGADHGTEAAGTRRALWLARALAVVAVLAVAAGVALVLTGGGRHVPPPVHAAPAEASELSAAGASDETAPQVQQPGTIRFPGGATSQLKPVTLTSHGALPVPSGVRYAAKWGAAFGAGHGATVLAGHVNWHGQRGPFAMLWRIRVGQHVSVLDARGRQWVYRITDLRTLHKSKLPDRSAELFGQQGPHRLVLVTCGGDYVGGRTGYQDNRIAIAHLVRGP